MTTILSVRITTETKKRLEALARRARRSKSFLVSGTPYVIPYRLRGDRLEVIAVFHGRQRWPARL